MDEITIKNDLPIISDSSIVEVARQAEQRIEAIKKIKKMALMVTNADDWVDENGKPYLQGSGGEKVAGLFNISWRIDEPTFEQEESGHFTYTYKGYFSMGARTIEAQGSRSSKDPFFKKYDWVDQVDKDGKPIIGEDGKVYRKRVEKPIGDIDRRDVKMAAYTNLVGNGITRILGIRNLTWEDLSEFAGVKQDQVRGVKYRKAGEQPPLKEPQKKTNGPAKPLEEQPQNPVIHTGILATRERKGTGPYFITAHLDGNEQTFSTFSKTIYDLATSEIQTSVFLKMEYQKVVKGDKTYLNVVSLARIEGEPKGQEDIPF
jgi:hypothetical protein